MIATMEPEPISASWLIGQAFDGRYFVSERWGDGACRVVYHDSLTDCLDDIRSRIEEDEKPEIPGDLV